MPRMCTSRGEARGAMEVCTGMAAPFLVQGELCNIWYFQRLATR